MQELQIIEPPMKQLDTIEDVFGISLTRMRMIEEIVRYDLRPECKRLGDLLYAVACCADFSEHEKVYAAFKVTQNNSRRGLLGLFHG